MKYSVDKVSKPQSNLSKHTVDEVSGWQMTLQICQIFSGDEVDLKKLDLPHHDRRILERLYWKREQDKAAEELVTLFGCSYFLPG